MIAPNQADEIAQIEHELSILRERYGHFQRGARRVHRFMLGTSLVLAGVGGALLIAGRSIGLPALLLGLLMSVWLYHVKTDDMMDAVSDVGPTGGWEVMAFSPVRSEAKAVARMIAEREQRLTLLKRRALSTP
ncbi:MAG TPA: hypothetical protein VEK73_20690 [Xanthobacteraceae bacterium]|nr:hypothetical protein [Xanthobacteraceae bacterium]